MAQRFYANPRTAQTCGATVAVSALHPTHGHGTRLARYRAAPFLTCFKGHTVDTTHCIGYAYPSSPMACALRRASTGCFYLQIAGTLTAHMSYPCAVAGAAVYGTAPDRWSMAHPLNAHFLKGA